MAFHVIPLGDSTFDRLIALRDEGIPAIAADAWPPEGGSFKIQVAGDPEYGDETWQLSVERIGEHAAEFYLAQPYMVSPTTDPATGFAVWGAAGVVLAIDPGEIGEQEIAVSEVPLPDTPDQPSFWTALIDRIFEGAYERPEPVEWEPFEQWEPEPTQGRPDPGGEFDVEVAGSTWHVHIVWHRYGTVRYTLTAPEPMAGAREVEAFAYAFSGHGAQVAFDDPAAATYGALAFSFEMSSNYELHEQPARLVDLARLTIVALMGESGQRIVLVRTAGEG